MTTSAAPTMGVEEEYFLVDPASRMPNCSAPLLRVIGGSAGVVDDLVRLTARTYHRTSRSGREVSKRPDRRDTVQGPAVVAEKQGPGLA